LTACSWDASVFSFLRIDGRIKRGGPWRPAGCLPAHGLLLPRLLETLSCPLRNSLPRSNTVKPSTQLQLAARQVSASRPDLPDASPPAGVGGRRHRHRPGPSARHGPAKRAMVRQHSGCAMDNGNTERFNRYRVQHSLTQRPLSQRAASLHHPSNQRRSGRSGPPLAMWMSWGNAASMKTCPFRRRQGGIQPRRPDAPLPV